MKFFERLINYLFFPNFKREIWFEQNDRQFLWEQEKQKKEMIEKARRNHLKKVLKRGH